MEEEKCSCGAKCWVAERLKDEKEDEKDEIIKSYGPCEGKIGVTEDYPGEYLHFCQKHGGILD
jgi:hypothetical protein